MLTKKDRRSARQQAEDVILDVMERYPHSIGYQVSEELIRQFAIAIKDGESIRSCDKCDLCEDHHD